jgi:hypothetical protein
MKRIIFLGLLLVFIMTVSANADTMGLTGNYGSIPKYAGSFVGPIESSFNGNNIPGGAMCIDAPSTSYFGSTWGVNVSTLQPLELTNSRYGVVGLFMYQEAAWLLGQIPGNAAQTGEIQFAAWRIFNPSYIDSHYPASTRNVLVEDFWLLAAANINPANYNWSDVKIYTPTEQFLSNQEFVSGGPSAVPIPGAIMLMSAGLLRCVAYRRRRK